MGLWECQDGYARLTGLCSTEELPHCQRSHPSDDTLGSLLGDEITHNNILEKFWSMNPLCCC